MELASKYDPQAVESKWYQYWLDNKLFSSKPDGREPYTVVIPPPNVTGVLHMGHMLNNTIQDILVRRARMEGKNACWVPGTDHASIATGGGCTTALNRVSRRLTLLAMSSSSTLGTGPTSTAASSSSSSASSVPAAIGTAQHSPWTSSFVPSSTYSATFTRRDSSISWRAHG